MKRVKFYSATDLGLNADFFNRVKYILNDFFKYKNEPNTIEDAIELQNITKVIDENFFSKEWEETFIVKIRGINAELKTTINRYLGTRESPEILSSLKTCENIYRDDFFYDFEHYNYGSKISEQDFEKAFHETKIPIRYLLKSNYFSKVYSLFLKNSIINDPMNIELLLSNFFNTLNLNTNTEKLTFPNSVTQSMWNELLDEYINSPNANFNYLTILSKRINDLDSTKFFCVTPKQKIKIKNKLATFMQKINTRHNGLQINSIIFLNREEFEKAIEMSKQKKELKLKDALEKNFFDSLLTSFSPRNRQNNVVTLRRLVDKEKINNTHGFKSLLSYYRTESGLFSKRIISTLPSYPNNEMGPSMRIPLFKTAKSYKAGTYFEIKQQLAINEIQIISSILSNWNIQNEDLLEWFFKKYCKEHYNIKWLELPFPNKDEFIGNQTATLFRIEESIRKQYSILLDEGKIENELVNLTSTPSITTLSSFFKVKYAYCENTNKVNNILLLLFSDQSQIKYIDNELQAESFFELLEKHNVKETYFAEYQRNYIDFLLANNIIEKINGYLYLKDKVKSNLLHEIYLFGSINFLHSDNEEKNALKDLEKNGLIRFRGTLFTQQESEYLNFLLNNKIFDDSWAIRNKYQHNTPNYSEQRIYINENIIAQLVLLIYMVKIDDELHLYKEGHSNQIEVIS